LPWIQPRGYARGRLDRLATLPGATVEGFRMIRWRALAAGAAVIVGAALVTGTSIPPKPPVVIAKGDEVKATILGQKFGYFNMPAVLRDYRKVKDAAAKLTERKNRMSANLMGLKAMQADLQAATLSEKTKPNTNAGKLEQLSRDLVVVTRQLEDTERDIMQLLNNQASQVIVGLYDEIRAAAVDLSRDHGLHGLFAYPDAVTPEETESPMVKELKLKPSAVMPFYLDPNLDYTEELLERLNGRNRG
jgi:Skp family chaperone for outer membrane proteins